MTPELSCETLSKHTDPGVPGDLRPMENKLTEKQSDVCRAPRVGVHRSLCPLRAPQCPKLTEHSSRGPSAPSGEGPRTEKARGHTPGRVCGKTQTQWHSSLPPPLCEPLGHAPDLASHLACYPWAGTGGPASGHPLALLPTGHPGSGATDNWSYRGLRPRSTSSPTAPSLGALGGQRKGWQVK